MFSSPKVMLLLSVVLPVSLCASQKPVHMHAIQPNSSQIMPITLWPDDEEFYGPEKIQPWDIELRADVNEIFKSAPQELFNFTELIKLHPMPTHLLPKGFIFYGPPGTGKTEFAKALAVKSNFLFYSLNIAEIGSKYVNQTARNLKQSFDKIRQDLIWDDAQAAILFIDEIDCIARSRSKEHQSAEDYKTVSLLLQEIEGIYDYEKPIIVVGATNKPDQVDEAIKSRLSMIHVGLPSKEARLRAVIQLMPQFFKGNWQMSRQQLDYIAENTDEMSYRDLLDILKQCAIFWYLNRSLKLNHIQEIITRKYNSIYT